MSTIVSLKIAELYVGDKSHVIVASGVGSCVVIVIYDPVLRIGGMAHSILPFAGTSKDVPSYNMEGVGFTKYADTAVDMLIKQLELLGGVRDQFIAKIIGGAHMFELIDGDGGIGWENTESARNRLLHHGVRIETEVIGGKVGRNVRLDCSTGIVEVITKV